MSQHEEAFGSEKHTTSLSSPVRTAEERQSSAHQPQTGQNSSLLFINQQACIESAPELQKSHSQTSTLILPIIFSLFICLATNKIFFLYLNLLVLSEENVEKCADSSNIWGRYDFVVFERSLFALFIQGCIYYSILNFLNKNTGNA